MAEVAIATDSLLVKIGNKEYEIIFSKNAIIIRSDKPIEIVERSATSNWIIVK